MILLLKRAKGNHKDICWADMKIVVYEYHLYDDKIPS